VIVYKAIELVLSYDGSPHRVGTPLGTSLRMPRPLLANYLRRNGLESSRLLRCHPKPPGGSTTSRTRPVGLICVLQFAYIRMACRPDIVLFRPLEVGQWTTCFLVPPKTVRICCE